MRVGHLAGLVFSVFSASSILESQSLYTPPALPINYMVTDLSATPVTGRRVIIPTGPDIDQNGLAMQAAIDQAQYGDDLICTPGAVYRAGSLELRANKTGTGYIRLEPEAAESSLPPPGTRVSPADKPSMCTIISPGGNVPPILTEPGAHNYRLIGLEVTKLDPDSFVQEMVVIDAAFNQDPTTIPSLSEFPNNIIIDRCYIHGLPGSDMKRAIRMHCSNCAVIDSYLSDAHVVGQDSQAIMYGGQTIKIDNNYLEGAAENLFAADYHTLHTSAIVGSASTTQATLTTTEDLDLSTGIAFYDSQTGTNLYTTVNAITGGTVTYEPLQRTPSSGTIAYWGLIPTDVEIAHNYMCKPLTWNPNDPSYAGYHPEVKNLFELKSGRRIWVHDNVLDHTWIDGQSGYAVLFTVRNENDQCYFCAVEDITFENNIISHANFGINMLATDNDYPSGVTRRILVRNNLWTDILSSLQVGSIDSLTRDHNTALIGAFAEEVEEGVSRVANVDINNIILSTYYDGYHYNSGDAPDWSEIFPGWILEANVMSKVDILPPYFDMPLSVASANYTVTDPSQVDFTDYANGNYTLAANSLFKGVATDGGDLGANVSVLIAEENSIESGQWPSQVGNSPLPAPPPPTPPGPAPQPPPPAPPAPAPQPPPPPAPQPPTPPGVAPKAENLQQFWVDPTSLVDPNRPTVIAVAPGATFTTARLQWNVPQATQVEIHIGSPQGTLFAAGGSQGSAVTGPWVTDGLTFYLQDRTAGKELNEENTLGVLSLQFGVGYGLPRKENLALFALDPTTITNPNMPTTIRVSQGVTVGEAHLVWNAPQVRGVEIHVGSPWGTLFATGGPQGTATTGPWVTDALTFYLQDQNKPRDSSGTIAVLMVHLTTSVETNDQQYGLASFYFDPATLPNPSLPTSVQAGGVGHLMWSAPGVSSVEIHVGSPAGTLFARGASNGSATTGNWVSNGLSFYLQNGDQPLNRANTLAVLTALTVPQSPAPSQTYGMASFYFTRSTVPDTNVPTTISPDPNSLLGTAHLEWCAPGVDSVQIRIGSPSGVLFASGGSQDTAIATGWVSDGLTFYLQDGSNASVTSPSNTLAILVAHVATEANP